MLRYYYDIYADKIEFWKDVTILVLYVIIIVLGAFGNIVVCYVTFVLRRRSTTYLLIGNMALSDLLSAIVIPLQWYACSTTLLDSGALAQRICGLLKTLQIVSYFISTFTMSLIAIDRFMILYWPLSRRRLKPNIAISFIWFISIFLNIPTLVSMRVSEYFTATHIFHCRIIFPIDLETTNVVRKARIIMLIFCQYLIPLAISVVFYGLCIRKMIFRQRIGECTDGQTLKFYRSKMRTIKMLAISLAAFMLGWAPITFVRIIDFFIIPVFHTGCNASFTYQLFYWLSISSFCYNPFIYCWFDPKFREVSRNFLNCCCLWRFSSPSSNILGAGMANGHSHSQQTPSTQAIQTKAPLRATLSTGLGTGTQMSNTPECSI